MPDVYLIALDLRNSEYRFIIGKIAGAKMLRRVVAR